MVPSSCVQEYEGYSQPVTSVACYKINMSRRVLIECSHASACGMQGRALACFRAGSWQAGVADHDVETWSSEFTRPELDRKSVFTLLSHMRKGDFA